MVILGLGSNVGDRLAHLRLALALIKKIPDLTVEHVSPVYISDALLPDNAPTQWDTPYLNLALRCQTTLTPYELLHHTKEIEKQVGRKPEKNWGPRIIDIDLLVWDALIQYDEKLHIPHENLHERPFALFPLADVAPHWTYPLPGQFYGRSASEMTAQWGSRFNGDAPFHTRQIAQRIDTPQLVGILNVTPDSFSDGGNFTLPEHAVKHAEQLVMAGADVIDIGAESTRPQATPLSPSEEWQRLEPVLTHILAQPFLTKPKISVDTRHATTARRALALNVDWINDVSGLQDPAMCEIIASHACDVVIMHHLSMPEDRSISLPTHHDPVKLVLDWFEKKLAELEKHGIKHERIMIDPGIGFGKTPEQSLALLQQIHQFHSLGTRILVGHSRKSFLTLFTPKPAAERDLETVLFSLLMKKNNVDYLRVHNIEMHARAFKFT